MTRDEMIRRILDMAKELPPDIVQKAIKKTASGIDRRRRDIIRLISRAAGTRSALRSSRLQPGRGCAGRR